jgi:hypothetical protein
MMSGNRLPSWLGSINGPLRGRGGLPRILQTFLRGSAKLLAHGIPLLDADNNQIVMAAGANSIETPRLLLNPASSLYPDGLANSSGQVGRNYMRHMSGAVWAIFEKPVRMYRGNTMAGCIKD